MRTLTPSRRRWLVVSTLAIVGFVIGGAGAVVIGLCIRPLMTEFGWSNALTSGMATAFNMAGLLSVSGTGFALDRWGARPIMTFGVFALITGLAGAALCHTWVMMSVMFAVAGIGYFASFYVPSSVVIANWMGAHKSLAMGWVMGATSVGAAILAPILSRCIERYGWRATFTAVAASALLMLPLILLTVRTHPPSDVLGAGESPPERKPPAALKQLLCSPIFLLAAASNLFFNVGMGCLLYHLVAVLIQAGYSAYWAGFVYGATWLFSALGSLAFGILADRLGAKVILAASLLCGAFGTLFLLGVREAGVGIACVAVFATLWGASANSASQFIPVILAERLGSHDLGTLIGVQSALAGVAGAAAPMVTGLLYDHFGSYRPSIYLSAAATLLASLLVSSIQSPVFALLDTDAATAQRRLKPTKLPPARTPTRHPGK